MGRSCAGGKLVGFLSAWFLNIVARLCTTFIDSILPQLYGCSIVAPKSMTIE